MDTKQLNILESFYKDCTYYWETKLNLAKGSKEALLHAIYDVKNLTNDPSTVKGELLDQETKDYFIKECNDKLDVMFFEDCYNRNKVWEVTKLDDSYYLRQYVDGKPVSEGIKTTEKYIKNIGIFDMNKVKKETRFKCDCKRLKEYEKNVVKSAGEEDDDGDNRRASTRNTFREHRIIDNKNKGGR